eukprot:gene47433-46697_t
MAVGATWVDALLLAVLQHRWWRWAEEALCMPPAAPAFEDGWRRAWVHGAARCGGVRVWTMHLVRDAIAVAATVAAALAGFDLDAAEAGVVGDAAALPRELHRAFRTLLANLKHDVRDRLFELTDEEVIEVGRPAPPVARAQPTVQGLFEEQRVREEEHRRIRDAEREQQLARCGSKVRLKREGRAAQQRRSLPPPAGSQDGVHTQQRQLVDVQRVTDDGAPPPTERAPQPQPPSEERPPCVDSLHSVLRKLGLQKYEADLRDAGWQRRADLLCIASPDDVPRALPPMARNKLADWAA